MKVLYIEDSAVLGPVVKRQLEDFGNIVTWVQGIAAASEEMSMNEFDRIICDGTLDSKNRCDGVRFAQALIAQGKTNVVVFTADTSTVPEGVPFVGKNEPGHPNQKIQQLLGLREEVR